LQQEVTMLAGTKVAENHNVPKLSKTAINREGAERIRFENADAKRRLEDIAAVAAAAASARSPSEKEEAIEWLRRREEEEKAVSGLTGKNPFRLIRPLRIKAGKTGIEINQAKSGDHHTATNQYPNSESDSKVDAAMTPRSKTSDASEAVCADKDAT
jgi:hypothetical protein